MSDDELDAIRARRMAELQGVITMNELWIYDSDKRVMAYVVWYVI